MNPSMQHLFSTIGVPTMLHQSSIAKYGLIHLLTEDHSLFEKNFASIKVTQGKFITFRTLGGDTIPLDIL